MTKYFAPALDKGLDILEYLSGQSIPQSQQEIALGIERTPNEIYRMLVSLENRGYIAKDPISSKYSLTLRLFQLAHHHSPVDTMVKAAEIHMENLAHSINQSVHLSVLHHNKLMIVSQARSLTPVSLSVEIGSLFPLERTVSGKVILANLTKTKSKQILASSDGYKAMTADEKKLLQSDLVDMKGQSCASNKSLLTEGVTDFAAPVYNMQKNVVAVLAVSALTSQMRKLVSVETIEKELVETVEKIRVSLGINS
ncbi:IclR family transcriptional regulator [Labilibacter marinus]|uniref:IclR family transcriptional regulator n=1 Tax=Labilibacter marinus TaxID=1477105 RepID=UPI0008359122|nr:IclR family transcriptional regulator [Labilibacter marinus]